MVERVRGGGRLEGSVRHHAQPSAISNPYLPLPTPGRDRLPATLRAHYHIFSFYILFRTALLLIVVPFSTLALSAALSAIAARASRSLFSLLDSRRKFAASPLLALLGKRGLKERVPRTRKIFEASVNPKYHLFRIARSSFAPSAKWLGSCFVSSREHSISTGALTYIKCGTLADGDFRNTFYLCICHYSPSKCRNFSSTPQPFANFYQPKWDFPIRDRDFTRRDETFFTCHASIQSWKLSIQLRRASYQEIQIAIRDERWDQVR